MKKILIISPFNIFPPYWGGASRIYNLTKHLSEKNKIILLYTDYKQISDKNSNFKEMKELLTNQNVKLVKIESFGKFSQIFNPLLVLRGLKIIKKKKPDYIFAEFTWSGLHAMILRLLTGTPYVLDEHNVEFVRFKRMKRGNKLTIFLLKLYEKFSCKFAYKVFCVSKVDKNFLVSKLNVNKNKIEIVPNGVDTGKFYSDEEKRERTKETLGVDKDVPLILFYGKLDYKPNKEAIEIIDKEILPQVLKRLPNAEFLIVGDNPPLEFGHQNIIFTGAVENIEDYVNASDIVICPLLSGGGTRIKILESLACGRCVISTSLGPEGIDRDACENRLIVEDDWRKFSNRIISLIRNPEKDYISPKFTEKYSWQNIIDYLYF